MVNAHDALSDIHGTIEIFEKINEKGRSIEDTDKYIQDGKERVDFSGKMYMKDGVVYWAFGKYKDMPIKTDKSFCEWVLKSDFPVETKQKLTDIMMTF